MSGFRFAFFIAVVSAIWGAICFTVGRHLVSLAPATRIWKGAVWALAAVLFGIQIAQPIFFSRLATPIRGGLAGSMSWLSYGLMGLTVLLFSYYVAIDAIQLLSRLVTQAVSADGWSPDRRQALSYAGRWLATGGAFLFTGIGFREANAAPTVERVEIPIDALPAGLHGFSIAQVSDLHVGPTIGRAEVERAVSIVNSLDADLVALTGDFVDGRVSQLAKDLEPLSGLRSRHGSFFITGNHEYYSGADAWIEEFRRLGLQVLLNEHRLIDHGGATLALAGVTDLHGEGFSPLHRSDPARAAQGIPSHAGAKVLLAHQPGSCHEAHAAGFDLQISGHTHGGQFVPWTFVVPLAVPFVRGLGRYKNRMWVYVNRGTGYWGPPLRLTQPPEITLLRLIPAGGNHG